MVFNVALQQDTVLANVRAAWIAAGALATPFSAGITQPDVTLPIFRISAVPPDDAEELIVYDNSNATIADNWNTGGYRTALIASLVADLTPSTGTGAFTLNLTVKDGDDNVLENARVRVTEGATTLTALTDENGEVSFALDPATWAIAITKAGYSFTPTTFIVTATADLDFQMSVVTAIAPTDPSQSTGTLVTRAAQGDIQPNVDIHFKLISAPGSTDSFLTSQFTVTSDENGLLTAPFLIGATYKAKRAYAHNIPDTSPSWVEFTVADSGSFLLPQILGEP